MKRRFLNSKIHKATVTDSRIDYEGSCEIDRILLESAGIEPYEQIDIYRKQDVSAIIGLGLDTKTGIYASLRAVISLVPIASGELLNYYDENDYSYDGIGNGWGKEKYLSGQLFVGYRF